MTRQNFVPTEVNTNDISVYCKSHVTVIPCRSIGIYARLGALKSFISGILLASESRPGVLVIPECTVSIDDKLVPLQIIN